MGQPWEGGDGFLKYDEGRGARYKATRGGNRAIAPFVQSVGGLASLSSIMGIKSVNMCCQWSQVFVSHAHSPCPSCPSPQGAPARQDGIPGVGRKLAL